MKPSYAWIRKKGQELSTGVYETLATITTSRNQKFSMETQLAAQSMKILKMCSPGGPISILKDILQHHIF